MIKKGGIYIIIAIITFGLLLLVEFNKPKKLNWFPSYVSHHKIPYGTAVLTHLLDTKFSPNSVEHIRKPPIEFLRNSDEFEGVYFFVDKNVNFEKAELNAILDWVGSGNSLFISSEFFDRQLLDTLNLETEYLYRGGPLDAESSFKHTLVNKKLSSKPYAFNKDYYTQVFSAIDTVNTTIIGQVYTPEKENDSTTQYINFITQPFEKGTITLSSFPQGFTNYFILKDDNKDYTAGLLSYLNANETIYVDNYHKTGKARYSSPMYIFLNTKEFKWAYYMVLIGVLIYVVFEGKRKQRAIPIVKPLQNQTLDFTKVISNMYFENNQQNEIARLKINYFLDFIRTNFYLQTQKQDSSFFNQLALRSNHSIEEVKSLFDFFKFIKKQPQVTDNQIEILNKKIEEFKAKADGNK